MRFNQIVETTTAGSVATVAQPMMTQTRENVNVPGLKPVQQLMKGKSKKKGPYANSINEGKVKQLTMDLKELTDEEFKKKYNKTKVEIKADMKKVNEDDLAEQDLIVIPGQGRLRRTGFVKQDLDQGEHEGHTLKNSLHTIARAASDLDKRLSVQSEFPEWVSEKIGAAKGMMVTVMDYLISSQEMQQTDQGVAEEYNQGSSEATAKQVYQYLIQKIPGFMYTAPTADVKKAISKAMSFGPQISVPDLASYAYGILKTNDLDEGEKNTSYMNKQNQDFYNKNPNFKRDDRGVKFVGNQLASIVTPTNKPGQIAKKPMTPFRTQGVEEGNHPFRGVGGAFDRGDDERHDLDPTDWYIVKDGEMFSASIYPRQVQQAIAQGFSRTRAEAKSRANSQGVAEGYSLKKTNVNKYMEPGDPDEYTQDINIKDTDYEIINNKTGQVVGTASWTTNDYFGPGALKITMKNGATRWLDIWEREKGNPQTAFNRFVKDPKTAKKYKEQGVAEGKWDPFTGGDYGQTPRPQRVGQDSQDNDIATPDKEKDQAEWEAMLDYYGTNALVQRALGDLYKQTHGSGYHDSVVTPERYLAIIEKTLGGRTTTEKKYFPNKQAAHKYAKSSFGHVVSFEKIDNKEDTADLITLPVMLGLGQQKKKWMLQFPDERYAQKWAFQHKNVATILWPEGHNLEKDVTEGMDNTSYTPKIGDEVLWRHSDPRSKMMPMPGTVLAVAPGKVKLKIYSKRMIQDRGTDTVVLDLTQYGITPKQGVAEGSVDKKPYPKTWHDVDPKIGKLVDMMSPEEKVKKGYANPSILKKKKEQGVAEGHGSEELANEVYAEFERTYPNLARRADERTVHAAIMDVLNYGGDSNPSALAQDVARAVKQEMQQGVAEGSEQEYKIYFVIPEHEDYPDRHEPTEQTIVLANSPGEAARKFKAETPEAYIKDIIPLGQQGVAKGKIDFAKKLQKNVDKSNKAVVKTRQDIGSRIADIGAGGKEYNVKTDAAWDAAKKKVAEGSAPKEKQKTPYRDINGPEYKAAADKQKEKMAKDKEAEPGKKLADKIDNKKK